MNVVALAGGVGGAKLADGLYRLLPADHLTVIVNTGDDFEHLGLWICPDLDTICYTLAGFANADTGWGLAGETWRALEAVDRLGGPTWFQIGDRDLGTHLERTRRLHEGQSLSEITREFRQAWGIQAEILPMSDQRVSTQVDTVDFGELAFQEYFVHLQCKPVVQGFRFDGLERAEPAPGALAALASADLVVICPSNPWVSIGPILGLKGVREALSQAVVVAVSPIVGGRAIKGPAAKMYAELGQRPSAYAVASQYGSLLSGMVIDGEDEDQAEEINQSGIISFITQTIMRNPGDRLQLASEVVRFGETLKRKVSGS